MILSAQTKNYVYIYIRVKDSHFMIILNSIVLIICNL